MRFSDAAFCECWDGDEGAAGAGTGASGAGTRKESAEAEGSRVSR